MTAASAHAAEPACGLPGSLSTSGMTCGTLPVSNWSAATSRSHFVKKPATSMLNAAVRREHLRVAHPPEPLVALRAVGRHVDEVALLPPDDVVLELVDQRLRRLERAGRRHVRVHDDAGQAVERQLARVAVHGDVPESLEREVRLVDLGARRP